VPQRHGGVKPVYNPDGDNYWADATGVKSAEESGQGIVKTVHVDVS